jgi:HlyD family secretion protein
MTRMASRRIAGALLLAALAGAATYLVLRPEPAALIVGMVRTTEVSIAPELGGQLAAIRVHKGDRVHAGDALAELAAPELIAAVGQARATLAVATASRDHVYAGVRQEQVAALAAEISKAQSRVTNAEAQHDRVAQLARENFASQQALDEADNALASGRADVAEATANHAAAQAGPTAEERAIADTQVLAAAAGLAVLERRLEKNTLRAPADGIVQVIVAEVGEAVRAGQPVLAIETLGDRWLSFNVREDGLRGISVGGQVDVLTAGMPAPVSAPVTELLPLGSFATWQAERAVGDHDRNTLRMRVEAVGELAKLEPGMTVWLNSLPIQGTTGGGR